ncbi:unnamed protein product [Auanema sp. JU1783]|nr:unnamed protein product [Auanema sp. JU1783]
MSSSTYNLRPILLPSPPHKKMAMESPPGELYNRSPLPSIETLLPQSPHSPSNFFQPNGFCSFNPGNGTITPIHQPLTIITDERFLNGSMYYPTQYPVNYSHQFQPLF